jgi:hypothetical protein
MEIAPHPSTVPFCLCAVALALAVLGRILPRAIAAVHVVVLLIVLVVAAEKGKRARLAVWQEGGV